MKGKNFSTNNTGKRKKSDFYETPYSLTWLLLEHEKLEGTILEPAMAENIANSQVEVICLFGKENTSRSWGNKRFRGTFSNHIETKSASSENKSANIHKATFPVELPLTFLKQGYEHGSKVLDLFAGTGTTMIACEKLEMSCYMLDIEPAYVDVIVQRYVDYTGNNKIKLNGKEIIWQK